MKLADIISRIGEHTTESILILEGDPAGPGRSPRILWVNPAFERLSGYSSEEIVGQTLDILNVAETEGPELDRLSHAFAEGRPETVVLKRRTKDGLPYQIEVATHEVSDLTGRRHFWISIGRDVSRWIEREENYRERLHVQQNAERLLQQERTELAAIAAVAQNADLLISITDTEFRTLWANDSYLKRVGYTLDAIRGTHPCALLSKRSEAYSSRETAIQAVLRGVLTDNEVHNIDGDGREFWTNVRISALRDENGRPDRFVIVERDVTEERARRLELEDTRRKITWAAFHDQLTGLANRRGFHEFAGILVGQAAAAGQRVALLHIDLDHFKQINDTLGHAAGDAVLLAVSKRLQGELDADSFAARIGGDEFVIARRFAGDEGEIAASAERLIADLCRPIMYGPSECRIGASIGYSIAEGPEADVEALMIEADIALYRAKENGRAGAAPFDKCLARETRARKEMAAELAEAFEQGQFRVAYQPQFDAMTWDLSGVEALVRWQHPRLGLIEPADFLPLARDLGLEARIDREVMRTALHDLDRMRAAGVPVPHVSVNVSARRLRGQDFLAEVADLVREPGSLAIELVESSFLNASSEQILATIEGLRALGVEIEIDDFGAGQTSIAGLRRIRPDRIKIDRDLTLSVLDDIEGRRLFEMIVGIGRTLGIGVIVEGVATVEHAELAAQLGCDVLQGHHISPPLAVDDFIAFFATAERQTGSL